VYSKKSTDIFWVNPQAPSTGATTYMSNAADIKGSGYEFRLNSINTKGAVIWQTGFNLSNAKTSVLKIYGTRNSTNDYVGYAMNPSPGRILYGIASYRWAGLDPQTGDPRGYLRGHLSSDYTAIFADSIQNQVFHGSSIPLQYGNLTNSVKWNGFTFYANISYRLNFYYRKPTISYADLATSSTGNADYVLRWQQPGDELRTNVPSFAYPLDASRDRFFAYSEVNVLRGDNIRLDDLRLQYDWKLKSGSMIKSLQLSVAANRLNIIIWKKDKSGYDPDYTGASLFIAPTPAMWTGSLNIGF
jgi:hypothetical protein